MVTVNNCEVKHNSISHAKRKIGLIFFFPARCKTSIKELPSPTSYPHPPPPPPNPRRKGSHSRLLPEIGGPVNALVAVSIEIASVLNWRRQKR